MSQFIATSDIKRLDNPKIYFDANIWMFIHCPLGNYNATQVNEYSSAFSTVLSKKFSVYSSFSTISEFINRYLRLAGSEFKVTHNLHQYDYKRDFRGTPEFTNALEGVKKAVKKILKYSTVIHCPHDNDSIAFLSESSGGEIDFNDQEIVELCKLHDLFLLTDDGDFKDAGISVISSNRKYF